MSFACFMGNSASVTVRREVVTLPTFEPQRPDPNPMFFEKRVYQGSSGRVYPLPFTDRIAEEAKPHPWDAVYLENEYLTVMLLPQLGGRIHRILDKTNGYDAIYHQPVIKPALVGLAGPWCSGGIEFNWPQHHRPSTFLPADVAIENHDDGSATVWMSEHDPMARMKGMHGVRLHARRSVVELVARVHNRTDDVQTFLWWANVAIRVHEGYKSIFPPDASYVADHAKRAMSEFPLCAGIYYGVDYAARARDGVPAAETPQQYIPSHCGTNAGRTQKSTGVPAYAPNDLSWYANIPVPTSYMCMGTEEDFCGGYDYKAGAGFIHVANHHISPGKKQWTWGNHEFGYAWDRNLTEPDPQTGEYPPYIELMAGVYTDNQPDFSFLQPGESRGWSQFWYPIRGIGPAQQANVEGAISLVVEQGTASVGVAVTTPQADATVRLEYGDRVAASWTEDISPEKPFLRSLAVEPPARIDALRVRVLDATGSQIIAYAPKIVHPGSVPPAATEPASPAEMASADELFLTGLHLEQYRHATRSPESYWREALRRDSGDARCNLALGRWHLRRGEFDAAEQHLRASMARLTARNPNPADGEPHYQLGICLRHQAFAAAAGDKTTAIDEGRLRDAYDALYKATWNQAWQSAGFHALAEIDALLSMWRTALGHLDEALRVNTENSRARNLRVIALRRLKREDEAASFLEETLRKDPLDCWARHLNGETLATDTQVRLDVALDYARAGLFREALAVLDDGMATSRETRSRTEFNLPDQSLGTGPLVSYYRAWLCHLDGDETAARRHLREGRKASPEYCFPARLEEIAILSFAIASDATDGRAPYYLGNLLFDRRRHEEAISLWQRAVKLDPTNAVAWRNLGIGHFNVLRDPRQARRAYDQALRANPTDARLVFERDQLWKRLGESPAVRLRELEKHATLVESRDDLTIERCALYNQTGQPERALAILEKRRFQPWEGGEGQALGQHVRTHLALGRQALQKGDAANAIVCFERALHPPRNLGEARHLLANCSDIHFWLGEAYAAQGDTQAARRCWTAAAEARGDFQEMSVRAFSEMSYYSALALEKLGRRQAARKLLRALLVHAQELARAPAKIDYFATSLPTMLLFDDDLAARQKTSALFLEAQARLGLGEVARARRLLGTVLKRDSNHPLAVDLVASLPVGGNQPRNGGMASGANRSEVTTRAKTLRVS